MIGYVTVGTNDFDTASKYYDALLAEFGAKRLYGRDDFILWSSAMGIPGVALVKPHDGKAATVGNGMMVSLRAENTADVDRVHAKALALNSMDEGAPGPRGGGFYGAYFRDLAGNKFCVYTTES